MLKQALDRLVKLRMLRRIALPVLERFGPGDVRIRHHYTRQPILLHTFRHKGYWFHGRSREQPTMQFFANVLRVGDTVIEVGGNIGYMSMYFAELVQACGRVYVFEPGLNNLPYIRANIEKLPTVKLIEVAVSDSDGTACFFEETLTGQNNSLLGDYHQFSKNRALSFPNEVYNQRTVSTVRLDTFAAQESITPDLIKIDIEGAEYSALVGAAELLSSTLPVLMVEVTCQADKVCELLTGWGYRLYAPEGRPLGSANELSENICALHPTKHEDRLRGLGWQIA